MIRLLSSAVLMLFLGNAVNAQQASLGIFEGQTDVGDVKIPGSLSYDAATQQYTIAGAGNNMWTTHDGFHFAWRKMKGDFIVSTRGSLIGNGVDPHRKFGWMVRPSLDSTVAHINAVVHGDGLTSLQFRRAKDSITEQKVSTITFADVVQLMRRGNTYTMSVARNGETYVTDQMDLNLGDEVYVGLFVCSHNSAVLEKAVFSNTRISVPAKPDFIPYREYIGSNLEILDVQTTNSTIIYQSPRSLQAPNWMKNGKSLIYNSEGLLYKFDLATTKTEVINTGIVNRNNNDHAISFDGKMLAISHNSREDSNKSIVFTVPITGGEPKRLTTKTDHSYFHGWSPDDKFLVFTGQRNKEFDIYKIPSAGGDEIRLTSNPGLEDGPEYSPDGKYIYFNSSRTGLMQIYRMKPDGSEQEQVTSDDFNNWFAHPSPDGKWIVYLSFTKEVKADDHPFYKQVYLRLMPAAGGPSKVIAYVYGGQGTINTPSWSPDSKKLAFISNTSLMFDIFPRGK